MDKILELRLKHEKEHSKEYNVPPAFCPPCQDDVKKLDPNFKENKKAVEDVIKGEKDGIVIK